MNISNNQLTRSIYVIQEHHATHFHWDQRFEIDGTLKSWALPKGAPQGNERRLAVQVEDHPISYATFEGTIPEGSYGAGEVKIWDSGTFELESYEPYKKKLVVNIHGRKLKGLYCLLHFRTKDEEKKKNNWLFFKVKNTHIDNNNSYNHHYDDEEGDIS